MMSRLDSSTTIIPPISVRNSVFRPDTLDSAGETHKAEYQRLGGVQGSKDTVLKFVRMRRDLLFYDRSSMSEEG